MLRYEGSIISKAPKQETTDSNWKAAAFSWKLFLAQDLRTNFLQRHAAACREAASHEADPAVKAVHLQNLESYLEELKQLRSDEIKGSEAA